MEFHSSLFHQRAAKTHTAYCRIARLDFPDQRRGMGISTWFSGGKKDLLLIIFCDECLVIFHGLCKNIEKATKSEMMKNDLNHYRSDCPKSQAHGGLH
jgi:hypothetical protein